MRAGGYPARPVFAGRVSGMGPAVSGQGSGDSLPLAAKGLWYAGGLRNMRKALFGMFVPAVWLVVAGNLSATASEPKAGRIPDLPRGISTWTYGFSPGIARKVKSHTAAALPHLGFRYFFPYAGSVSFVTAPDLEEAFAAPKELPEPVAKGKIDGFSAPANWGDGYFSRVRGYIHPSETGEYTFWLASDDDGRLYLSSDTSEKNKVLIASVKGWSGLEEWDKYPSQKSKPVRLERAKRYYVEVLHREGGGADHLSVAWEGPGLARSVIGRDHVSACDNPPQKGPLLIERWRAKDLAAGERKRFVTGYEGESVRAYAASLPRAIMLLPIVDGRNPEGAFDDWTDDGYREVAAEVARAVLDDPHAAGVHIDIEPFRPSHLPFYRHLREMLNARGKLTSMFVGFVSDEVMTGVFEACDIVVISGYDLGCGNSLECYRNGMAGGLERVQRIAEATGGRYLVGIPAAASWGEYEYAAGEGCEKRETGVKQEEYVRAATGLVCSLMNGPQCLGVSLWVMNDPETTAEDPTKGRCPGGWRSVDGCCKFPNVIRDTVWKHLAGYCPGTE